MRARQCAIAGAIILATTIGYTSPASAERVELWSACWNKNSAPAQQIAACSALIQMKTESSSNLAIAHNSRGLAYAATGNHDGALEDFSQAISLGPKVAAYFYNRGNAWLAKGEIGRAISDYNRAIQINPSFAEAQAALGVAYSQMRDFGRAVPYFDKAIRIDSEIAIFYRHRGAAYHRLGDPEHAIVDFSQAIRLDPKDLMAYIDRGAAYYALASYVRALTNFNAADATASYERALADFNAALKLDPNYVEPLYGRGMARQKLGDSGGAADVAEAVSKQPNIAVVMAGYGVK